MPLPVPLPPNHSTISRIAIVGYEGFQLLDVTGPAEVFAKANDFMPDLAANPLHYEIIVASPAGGTITSSSGLSLAGTLPLEALGPDIDTLLISGGPEGPVRRAAEGTALLPWLAAHAPGIRRVASICTGAFLLGASGLLDGRRATTHWSSTRLLETLLPRTEVVPDAIFVGDGHIFTSAGVTAGIDLALAFVEYDCGPQVALRTARELVLYLRRVGGQSQFSSSLAAQANTGDGLQSLVTWIAGNPEADLSVAVLADRAVMSERTFARTFRVETGMTPARYVELVRLDRAKQLLESTRWPLARIAERAGLGSASTLSRAFRKHLGTTPEGYRERFRIAGSRG
jgi:transcriptional regulator GlxA family with amidase domain